MDHILSAPEPTIRAILVALCDDGRLQALSLTYLDQLNKYHAAEAAAGAAAAPGTTSPDLIINGPPADAHGRSNPPGPPPQICVQCRTAFNPGRSDDDEPGACLHHDGDLLIDTTAADGACWAGWDEAVLGPRDTAEGRDAVPRGFIWTCCRRDGTKPGCARAAHVAVRGRGRGRGGGRRLRLPGPGQDPDVMRMFEGRVLRPNEFVNEDLWADRWDDSALGGAPSGMETDEEEEEEDDDDDDDGDDDGGVGADVSDKTERNSGGGSDSQDMEE